MYGVQYVIYIERETVLCSVWCPVCYIYRKGDCIVQCMVSQYAIYIERETVLCSVWCPVCYIYREGDCIVQCMVSSMLYI